MTNPEDDLWLKLSKDIPSGSALTARIAFPDVSSEILAAIDSSCNRHFLIPIIDTDEEIIDNDSRGLRVNSNFLKTKGEGENASTLKYIDVKCMDRAGFDGFNLIGRQITEAVINGNASRAESVRRVLARWRYFWGNVPRNILSNEQIIGLFGELWFLRYWLLPRFEHKNVLESWTGPKGGRHDFEFRGLSIEVKGTALVEGRKHWIHGIDQLIPPDNGILLFYSIKLREEANASRNLPDLVRSCREIINANTDALDLFENALALIGYSPVHEIEYDKIKFRVIDEALFRVNDSFPKLTSDMLINGSPFGVDRVEYQINLDGFENCIIAKNPENFHLIN
ncbi:MAG: PD-(D/E)XK motif protein [Thermoplasmatales archaeon]